MLVSAYESDRLHQQLLQDMDQITQAWDRKAEGKRTQSPHYAELTERLRRVAQSM